MRLLGAVRLSNLTDETTAPERQRAEITIDPAVVVGSLVAWAEDLDISADIFSPFKRPKLGPWLTDKEKISQYDGLIFAEAGRAIRSMMDMYELSQWAITHRKVIIFVKGPGGGPRMELDFRNGPLDPITQLIVTIFAFAGEIEVGEIKRRTRDSQAHARKEGRWHGGTPVYGLRPVKQPKGEGWKLEPDPDVKNVLDDITHWVLNDFSLNSICHILNGAGVPSPADYLRVRSEKEPTGSKWTATVLTDILRSRALLGYKLFDGAIVRTDDGLPVMQSEPVFKRYTWNQIQEKLDRKSITKARTRKTSPLLGVPFCLSCGRARDRNKSGDGMRVEYYRCRGKVKKLGCDQRPVRGDALTSIIETQLLEHIGNREVQEEVFIPGESHQAELKDAIEGLSDLLARSAGKSPVVKAIYDRQIASLEALIERLSALPETPSRREYLGTGKTYREVWEGSDTDQRRKMLLDAGVRIEVAQADGGWVSVGRFERPERYDQAVSLGIHNEIQYAFYLPKDLVDRIANLPVT